MAVPLRASQKRTKERIADRVRMARPKVSQGESVAKAKRSEPDWRLRTPVKCRAITSAQSQPASLLVESTSEHHCVRIDGWLRRPWQRSSFQRFCRRDQLPEDGSTHTFTERDFW